MQRFHKLHEGVRADHADILFEATWIHLPQATAERLLRQDVALGGVRPQAHNGRDVSNVPTLFQHHDRHNGLIRTTQLVDVIRFAAQFIEFLFVLPGGGLGNFAVRFRMNHQHFAQVGVVPFQVGGHIIAVARVIRHHEEDGLLAHFFMDVVSLAPFDHTEV